MQRSHWLAVVLAATFVAGFGAPARAGEAAKSLAEADRNGDGKVDRGEFHQRMVDVFYTMDADRDGSLAKGELKAADASAFESADLDGNGMISLKEYVNARFADFSTADRDRDGVLSLEEVQAW